MTSLSLSDIESFFDQIPGIVLFHLTVAVVSIAVLAVLLFQRSKPGSTRAILICLLVFILQCAGFFPYGLGLFGVGIGNVPAGITGRLLLFATILLFGWIALFPQRNGKAEWLVGIAGVLSVGIGLGASWILPPANPMLWFNSQNISLVWDGLTSIWISIFLLWLLISLIRGKRPHAWGLVFFGLLLLLMGTSLQIGLFPRSTQLPGIARFFDLWAFPLLLMRLVISTDPRGAWQFGMPTPSEESGAFGTQNGNLILDKIRKASAEYSPFLADLFLSEEDEGFVRALTGWLCHAAQAEVAFLLAVSDEGQTLIFLSGYDCVGSRTIPGFVLPTTPTGLLSKAVGGHSIVRMNQAGAETELLAVAREAGLPHTGPGIYTPLGDTGEHLGGILLLSPFSGADWRGSDETLVAAYGRAVTGGMRFIIARAHLRHALEETRGAGEKTSAERDALRAEKRQWEEKIRLAEQALAEEQKRAEVQPSAVSDTAGWQEQRAELLAQIQQLEDQLAESASRDHDRNGAIDKLRADSDRLKDALASIASHQAETSRLKQELESVRQELEQRQTYTDGNPSAENEIARLKQSLADTEAQYANENSRLRIELDRKADEFTRLQSALLQPPREGRPAEGLSHSDLSTMSSLISELRQPMSSAVGYTDLLLSESAGILGALQRKFLERIRAGISRMEALLDDLLQIAVLADTSATSRLSPVDITSVIDAALTSSSDVIRERNLIVRMDIAETVPPAEIDHDALQQIVNHLIRNAALATPPEKEIYITANLPGSLRESQGALLLTVQDGGSGIPTEDQPRVFTRLYRAEGPLIEGLGDSGVGMAVARTLTEAMGGRIWLESQLGQHTTFFVLLPWHSAAPPADAVLKY
jgi:signal transduction histidine kinase